MATSWNIEAIKLYAYQLGKHIGKRKAFPNPSWYLYNDTKLPALPEWDDINYYYVTIVTTIGTDFAGLIWPQYTAYFTKVPMVASPKDGYDYLDVENNDAMSSKYDPPKVEPFSTPDKTTLNYIYGNAVWTNYNLLDKEGNVVMPASDPVPDYE